LPLLKEQLETYKDYPAVTIFRDELEDLVLRLEQAEEQVARVRELASEYRPTIPEEVLHAVMADILRALDGEQGD